MEQNRLKELEDQCIQDCAPPCTSLCPVHVDIRQIVKAILQEDFSAGLNILRKAVPFPGIVARTCDQPCQSKCNRDSIGGVIQVAGLEWACVQYGSTTAAKVLILPPKNAHVAIVGGGLSGLTAAIELSKKGFQVSLFEKQARLGGRLWNIPDDQLPREVIQRETSLVSQTKIDLHLGEETDFEKITSGNYDAIYLGIGEQNMEGFAPRKVWQDILQVDPGTFQTSRKNIFAGGSMLHPLSTILSISDGRRAAISIDRFLQKVSLTASRVNEGSYETRLITNISTVKAVDTIKPEKEGGVYFHEEAVAEAARCLQCECMECVKVCEYLRHYGGYPRKYIREIYNNLSIIMRTRTANKFINSCTLCGLCGEVCPTRLNMGAVINEVRQTMVKTQKMPASAHDFALRDMAFSNSDRFSLALGPDGKKTCSSLLFPGCQFAASNPEYIPRIYETLSSVLPDVGIMLRCCGAPADWAGEEVTLKKSIEEFKDQWQQMGKPELVLACSSCNSILKKYVPGLRTTSIWEVFERYRLFPEKRGAGKQYVIHDPCTSRYETPWQDSVRSGLTSMGVMGQELPMSRNLTECCGYGGLAWLAHPELVKDIIHRRIGEDPSDYLTYCVMCRDMFAAEGKRALHLLDIIYGHNLDGLAVRKGPNYSQRHENRTRVKQKMLQLLLGKDHFEVETYENYRLDLTPEMQEKLEARLILVEDIQKVIEHAETSGERFVNQNNDHALAFFKPNIITYWVEYTKDNEIYRIHDAYSHRMDFEGDASL